MRDKIKYVFIVPIVRQVALDNVPLRNGPSSQKFSEEPMFIFFLQWELIIIIQIKWLILLLLDYGILYKPPKWPVLYDKCIRKSMVVCNLWNTISCLFTWCIVLKWSAQKTTEACDWLIGTHISDKWRPYAFGLIDIIACY